MNIKSLLLGSAAALVAVSGAQAADAVVMAEPEPMEYVRVCDVYGVGYFYIPGTETCLRVGGYIRNDTRVGDLFDNGTEDTYNILSRFSLQVSTASETELGTLRTYAETRFNYSNGGNDVGVIDLPGAGDQDLFDTGVSLNFAWIQLGGFRVGKDESAFTVFPGYAGNVISDDLIGYGPFDTNLMSYTFEFGSGFSGIVSVEEGEASDEIATYVPHVVGGLKYTAGFGAITGVAAYDSQNEEFAGKVRVDVTINDAFSAFVMGGYKTDDGDIEENSDNDAFDNSDGSNYYGNWEGGDENEVNGGDGFAVWAGASYVLTPQATINGQVSYDEGENFAAVLNVSYELVPGLKITPEVAYLDNFEDGRGGPSGAPDEDSDDGEWGGILRFQRSF